MTTPLDIVADYGGHSGRDDLAFVEVRRALMHHLSNNNLSCSDISTLSVDAFDGIGTGFIVGQLANNSKIKGHLVFHNTAPRKDNAQARQNNDGEFLAAALMSNGTLVVGVNAAYTFAFLDKGTKICKLKCLTAGSQFRSRDIFPSVTAVLTEEVFGEKQISSLEESSVFDGFIEVDSIPQNVVAYVDGYGNMKTSLIMEEELMNENEIKVTIGDVTHVAKFGKDGIFSVADGDLVIANGSSGWEDSRGKFRFFEVVVRGGSASKLYGNPKLGTPITVSK